MNVLDEAPLKRLIGSREPKRLPRFRLSPDTQARQRPSGSPPSAIDQRAALRCVAQIRAFSAGPVCGLQESGMSDCFAAVKQSPGFLAAIAN